MQWLILILVILLSACSNTTNNLQIRFIDVGEGAATLISRNGDFVLVDAGNPAGAPELTKKIAKLTNHLNALVITHPHPDHTGAVFQLLDRFSPMFRYDNGEQLEYVAPQHWYIDNFRTSSYRALKRGDLLQFSRFQIEVLSPPEVSLGKDWNANSLVLKVKSENFCALLMADALVETEKYLLQMGAALDCPLIQVGHHGSKFASMPEFITSVRPQIAIVSVNDKNLNGYPSADTLARWEATGARVLRTDRVGDITISVNPEGEFQLGLKKYLPEKR